MARTVNFQYKYPYGVWSANSRFRVDYDTSQTYLSGNYTYPLSFQTNYPYVVKMKVTLYAENNVGTSILNRSWYLYLYNGSSWYTILTFTMPQTGTTPQGKAYGEYVWEGNVGYSGVRKFAAVPTAQMSTGTTWTNGITIEEMTIQESVTTVDLTTNNYFTVFPNYGGVAQRPTQIYANIGGTLTVAKNVYANIGGALTELPPAYNGAYTTTVPDNYRVYEFTPPSTGTYKIQVERKSGDHEARLYNSAFTDMNGGNYFYDGSFALTGGSLYYIMLTHYVGNTSTSDSLIFITKI